MREQYAIRVDQAIEEIKEKGKGSLIKVCEDHKVNPDFVYKIMCYE